MHRAAQRLWRPTTLMRLMLVNCHFQTARRRELGFASLESRKGFFRCMRRLEVFYV